MSENLFNSAHKHNSDKYVENWTKIFRKEKKMKLFSYGTLMKGQSRSFIMRSLNGKKLIDTEIKGFRLYANDDHPTVRKENGHSVLGEVWEFDLEKEKVLDQLDMIEGYPDYYDREEITINGEYIWVYIMTDMAFQQQQNMGKIYPLEGGNWKDGSERERAGSKNLYSQTKKKVRKKSGGSNRKK